MKINNQYLINYIFPGLIAVFFFVIIYTGYLRYQHEKQSVLKEKHQELYAISELKITHLVQWHKERLSEVGFFSVNNPYTLYAQEIIKGNREAVSLFRKSLTQIMTHNRYENVFMISEQGKLLFSVDSGYVFVDTITLFHTKKIFQTGKIIVRDFYFCNHHQKIHFDLIAPIINDDEKVIAALIFRVNPDDYLLPLIKQWPSPSETAETYIVGRRGDSIKYLHNLRHLNNSELTVGFPSSRTEITAVQAVMGHEGILEGVDYRGEKVLADVRKIPDTPWYIISEVDLKEIFIVVNKKYFLILIIAFILILFVGAAIALIYNYRQRNIYRELYDKKLLLHQTQEELRATIYSIGDGVITTDHQGFIRHINPVAENLTGWNVEEARGKKLEEVFRIINEETRKDEKSIVERVLREGKVIELSNRLSLITKNDSEIPIADSAAPIKDAKGNILGVVMVFSDQSEQRRKQKQLSESERNYRELINGMNETVWVIGLDGELIEVNNQALEILGYTKEELLTIGVYGVDSTMHKEEIKALIDYMPEDKLQIFETTHRTKDGRIFPVEIYSSIVNYQGKKAILSIARDISERKKAEIELRKSREYILTIINKLPIGLAVNTFSPEVKFEFMNENFARFYGVSVESLSEPGKFWDVVYEDPQYREEIKKRVEEDLKSNNPGRMEWTDIPIIHKGQPVRYISARDIPLPETDSVISTVWDVTERKLREDEVKKMNARLYHLNSILDLLVSAHNIEKVQEIITAEVRKLIGSDGCTFIVYEGDSCFYSKEDTISPLWKGMKFSIDKNIAGWVKLNRQSVIIKDIYKDERISVQDFKYTFVKSLLLVPINAPKPFGAVGNYWSAEYTPSDDEIRLMQILCDAIAGVYENLKLKEDLETRIKEKTHELQERISELERFREATINREIRMKELREEIKKLKGEMN